MELKINLLSKRVLVLLPGGEEGPGAALEGVGGLIPAAAVVRRGRCQRCVQPMVREVILSFHFHFLNRPVLVKDKFGPKHYLL